jgi:hypothetical protein
MDIEINFHNLFHIYYHVLKYSLDWREGHMKKIKCVCCFVCARVKGQRSKKRQWSIRYFHYADLTKSGFRGWEFSQSGSFARQHSVNQVFWDWKLSQSDDFALWLSSHQVLRAGSSTNEVRPHFRACPIRFLVPSILGRVIWNKISLSFHGKG